MKDLALLRRSIAQLAHDERFKLFIECIEEMKATALAEAVTNRSVENHAVLAGYMGEIRSYTDIISIFEDALLSKAESEPED